MTFPPEIPLRIASRGYSGLTRVIGTMPRRTAGFGGAGGAMTTGGGGGAITTGSGGGVGLTEVITGSVCVVGTGMSGGGTYGCCGGVAFGISIFLGGGGG